MPVPPVALREAAYPTFTVPFGKNVVVTESGTGGGAMTRVALIDPASAATESVAVTVTGNDPAAAGVPVTLPVGSMARGAGKPDALQV